MVVSRARVKGGPGSFTIHQAFLGAGTTVGPVPAPGRLCCRPSRVKRGSEHPPVTQALHPKGDMSGGHSSFACQGLLNLSDPTARFLE